MSVWEGSGAGGIAPVRVDLANGVTAALAVLPAAAGVAQIEGPDGKSLLLTRSANVRKWAAANLGAGDAPKAGKRPKVDLSGVATAVSFVLAETPFERTLVFERWMAPFVPYSKRKDLRPPVFLRLDLSQRFPRVVVVGAADSLDHAFGPFRDRKAGERASAVLHKVLPLRPCDHIFDPHEDLPLGRGCLYAQVRSCAAPCLVRVSEDAYRKLALDAAHALASPLARTQMSPAARTQALPARGHISADALVGSSPNAQAIAPPLAPSQDSSEADHSAPPSVTDPGSKAAQTESQAEDRASTSPAAGAQASEAKRTHLVSAVPATVGAARGRGLVVSKSRSGGILHPVAGGRVLDGVRWVGDAVEDAVLSLAWDAPVGAPDDWPWLATWLHTPAGRASFVVLTEPLDVAVLATAIRGME